MSSTDDAIIDVPSSDVLRLIQSHLVECGLRASSSALRSESGGVGLPGLFPSSKSNLISAAKDGRWGEVLNLLDGVDLEGCRRGYLEDYARANGGDGEGGDEKGGQHSNVVTPLEKASAAAHEVAVLELAERDEVDLAYATLRMCSEMIDRSLNVDDDAEEGDDVGRQLQSGSRDTVGMISSRSGDIERRITALSSMRRSSSAADGNSLLPADYYGASNVSRQKRRDQVAKLLKRHVPEIPNRRLPALIGQSVKWMCHTGTFPTVQRLFQQQEDEEAEDGDKDKDEGGKKKKKRHKKNVEQKFDLVLGNVDVTNLDGKKRRKKDGDASGQSGAERIPSRPYQSIRLGKKSYVESACFLPDGKGLVTGSSDGFVEVWGEPIKSSKDDGASKAAKSKDGGLSSLLPTEIDYEKLRTCDLPYQKDDDLMMHDSAVLAIAVSKDGTLLGTTSSDGTVCVWKVADGKLLRKLERAHGGAGGGSDKGAAVTCIQFSPDGSKVLTGGHDSTCREFGLLASRMLKEFRGHKSYVNCCGYVVLPQSLVGAGGGEGPAGSNSFLAVVTASADGSVRVWDGRTAEPIREINPPVPTPASNGVVRDEESIVGSKSVHTVLHLHSPANTMIVVPRSDRAYLMSYSGAVLRTYARDDVQGTDFLAAAVSTSNKWLFVAADDGKCVVFDVNTGKVEKIVASFAEECSTGRDARPCEVSGLLCHPHRGFVGGYSNDKGQKRGILTLWK